MTAVTLTCSVIRPARASSVFKIPCAWLTRRERNLRCISGTIRGSLVCPAVSGGGGGEPRCAQPARCSAAVPMLSVQRELSSRWGQAVPLQGPCLCSQSLVCTPRN
ncbi:unnamed protein product [Rangifer tarandus platyrhynchus]|uniref:Uncharacterized protein n=1 Tax=Rangifer tarandus platyrhynchus TaxID=3082113 RepID=A0AC59Y9T0_RANTA